MHLSICFSSLFLISICMLNKVGFAISWGIAVAFRGRRVRIPVLIMKVGAVIPLILRGCKPSTIFSHLQGIVVLEHIVDAFPIGFEEGIHLGIFSLPYMVIFYFPGQSERALYQYKQSCQIDQRGNMAEDSKFQKIVDKYNSKFGCSLDQFEKFITTRVQISKSQKQDVLQYLAKNYNPNFSQQDLRKFLHLLAAKQAGRDLEFLSDSELGDYKKIKFISRDKRNTAAKQPKKQEEGGGSSTKRTQNQSQSIKNQQHLKSTNNEKPYDIEVVEQNDEQISNARASYYRFSNQPQKLGTILQEKSDQINPTITEDFREQSSPKQEESPINDDDIGKFSGEFTAERREEDEGHGVQMFKKGRKSHEIAQDKSKENDEISIAKFEKTGQDFMNPIIKFQIIYKNEFTTWRRYSEIERLMAYLRRKYEGVVLPQMPPKEGIKGGFNYLWGSSIDEAFLFERGQKLSTMLNRLLLCHFVNKDEKLIQFLTDENFQLNSQDNDDNYWQALSGFKDIVLNYNQLKDYGMAYYNYISQYKNKPLDTVLSQQYQELQEIVNTILITNEHRKRINENFDRRRDIIFSFNKNVRQPIKTELDKVLEKAEVQCQELAAEYSRYVQLKSTESWLAELKKQKTSQEGTKSLQKIYNDLEAVTARLKNIEKNMADSMKDFKVRMENVLKDLGANLIEWRKKVHP